MTTINLPRAYLTILAQLDDAGGAGTIDRYGRVVVGDTRHPISGDATTWLNIVAHGLVAGEDGKLIMTQLGRDVIADYREGLIRKVTY